MRLGAGLLALVISSSAFAAEPPLTVEKLNADGWEIAGYTGTFDKSVVADPVPK